MRTILFWLASAFSLVMAPTFYQMTQHLDPTLGWPLIGASLALAAIFAGLAIFLPSKRDEPKRLSLNDFKEVDGKQYLELHELAAYWANEKPRLPLSKKAAKQFAILQAAIETKNLKVLSEDQREVIIDGAKRVNHGLRPDANPHWRVSRQDALDYASSNGGEPAFLFPKKRVHA